MNNNPKSTKEAPPETTARETPPTPETAPYTAFATLFHKGVERLAEMQKQSLDLIAYQTADTIGVYKQRVPAASSGLGASLLDVIDQGIDRMAQSQKAMIDLVVQQSAHAIDMSKERRDVTSRWTSEVTEMFGEAAERAVAAQKICLNFAAEQNKTVTGVVKRQAAAMGSTRAVAAVDTFQHNVDMATQTQQEMMDAATKPLKAAAASAGAKQAA
jgi:hypothetical protein